MLLTCINKHPSITNNNWAEPVKGAHSVAPHRSEDFSVPLAVVEADAEQRLPVLLLAKGKGNQAKKIARKAPTLT